MNVHNTDLYTFNLLAPLLRYYMHAWLAIAAKTDIIKWTGHCVTNVMLDLLYVPALGIVRA